MFKLIGYGRTCVSFRFLGFKSGSQIGSREKEDSLGSVRLGVFVCGSVCVLILIFRRGLLSIPTCVNTPADQMADNDFQIDTLHSTSRENQWALIAFFPRRSSPPWRLLSIYLSLSLFLCVSLSISPCLSPIPIHAPLNITEIESIPTAFEIYCEKMKQNISLSVSGLC